MTVFWIRLCINNCSVMCAVTSTKFNRIKICSSILKHYQGIFWIIKAYSAPCVIFAYLQTCHDLSPGIYRTESIFKTIWIFYQAYRIYWSTECSFNFGFTKEGGRLFEGGPFSTEALIKYIKKTSKYFHLVSLIRQ